MPSLGELAPKRLRESDQRRLGRDVDRGAGDREDAGHGRRVDDVPALAVREHPRKERLDPVDDAAEQDAQAPVPVVVPRERDRPEDAHAGVVAEHVHVAEDALGLVGRPRESFAVGDVQLDRVHGLARRSPLERVSMWSRRRSAMTTFIPAATNAVAMPSPMPLAPPVTNAVLPSTSCISRPARTSSARAFAARRPSSTASRSAGTGSSGKAASVSSKISRSSSRWSGCVKT